jgi:hypothetical protein
MILQDKLLHSDIKDIYKILKQIDTINENHIIETMSEVKYPLQIV